MRRTPRWTTFILASVVALVGCGNAVDSAPVAGDAAAATDPATPPAAESRPARTLPIPGQAEVPPGHPPIDERSSGPMRWTVPADWKEVEPSSNMRIAQYVIPGPAGDAECIVFYFGARQGGDARSNALRWAGQFTGPDGQPATESMTMTDLETSAVPASIVEVTGTYDGGMTMTAAPPEKKAGYMLLGGIAQGKDAPWFFKLTGPEATVRAQRSAFIKMMQTLEPGD